MFNARAETITSSPAFRDAFVRKRCLVPVDSFYEWKREGTIRQPYRVVERDGRPLALAGLWAGWRDPATDTVRRTFTIITTTPNEALGDLHDRMPVVVAEGAWERWLDPSPADPGELLGLLVPNEAVELDVYAVERFVNDVRRDGPELIEPLVLAAARRPVDAGRVRPRRQSAARSSRRPHRVPEGVTGLGAVIERGGERATRSAKTPSGSASGASNTTTSVGQAVRDPGDAGATTRTIRASAQRAASATIARSPRRPASAKTTTAKSVR